MREILAALYGLFLHVAFFKVASIVACVHQVVLTSLSYSSHPLPGICASADSDLMTGVQTYRTLEIVPPLMTEVALISPL